MPVLAFLLIIGWLSSPAHASELASFGYMTPLSSADVQSDGAFESQLRGWTRSQVRATRRWIRSGFALVKKSALTWLRWFRRAVKFVLIAAVVALAEGRLLSAWRLEGLPPLRTYVPLMLYVYARLVTDRRVRLLGKIPLGLSIVYGVVPRDAIPDRSLLPGLLDDVFVIVIGVHILRMFCAQPVVDHWARKAIGWHARLVALRRARRPGRTDA